MIIKLIRFTGAFDPELRSVLELASDDELYELETILFGPRWIKSSIIVIILL